MTSFDYNYQNAFRCNLCFVDFVERFFKNEKILNAISLPQSALQHTQNRWKFPGQKSMFGEILLSGAFVVCTFDVPLYYWGQHCPRVSFAYCTWSSVKVPINQFCSCSFSALVHRFVLLGVPIVFLIIGFLHAFKFWRNIKRTLIRCSLSKTF